MQACWPVVLVLHPSSQRSDMSPNKSSDGSSPALKSLPPQPSSVLAEDPDIKGQREAHSSVPCLNSSLTEPASIRRGWLFYATKSGVACYSPIITETMRNIMS